jgi:hypothetical protein
MTTHDVTVTGGTVTTRFGIAPIAQSGTVWADGWRAGEHYAEARAAADRAERLTSTDLSIIELALKVCDRPGDCGDDAINIIITAAADVLKHVARDREPLMEARVAVGDPSAPVESGAELKFHNDSSTGDDPAATGHTDSVEVTARRGDDSDPGELGDLAQAWRDVVTDYAAGRLQVTVSSSDADIHWCRLHRLMQAHTKEAES